VEVAPDIENAVSTQINNEQKTAEERHITTTASSTIL
jgi:hypothetical protein